LDLYPFTKAVNRQQPFLFGAKRNLSEMSDEPAIWQTLTEAMKKQQQCLSKATVTHTLWDEGDVEVPSAKRAKYNQPPSVRSSIHTHAMVKRPSTLDEETMNVVSKFNDYTAYEDC
jgi:hypothetical protein